MTPNEYQYLTRLTWNRSLSDRDRRLNAALGIGGEAGEVLECVKKEYFHGKDPNPDKLKDELGDVLYYIARLADEYGLPLSEIMEHNYRKLNARYPDGFVNGGGNRGNTERRDD